jgi:hypothetical protein
MLIFDKTGTHSADRKQQRSSRLQRIIDLLGSHMRLGEILKDAGSNYKIEARSPERQLFPPANYIDKFCSQDIKCDVFSCSVLQKRPIRLVAAADIEHAQIVSRELLDPGAEQLCAPAKHKVMRIRERRTKPALCNPN